MVGRGSCRNCEVDSHIDKLLDPLERRRSIALQGMLCLPEGEAKLTKDGVSCNGIVLSEPWYKNLTGGVPHLYNGVRIVTQKFQKLHATGMLLVVCQHFID